MSKRMNEKELEKMAQELNFVYCNDCKYKIVASDNITWLCEHPTISGKDNDFPIIKCKDVNRMLNCQLKKLR